MILQNIKVIPGAKKNQLQMEADMWKVYLTAPPQDGKANKALISFLAKELGLAKSRIKITKGLKSRHKTIKIQNLK